MCPVQTGWFITYQWVAGNLLCKLVLFAWMFLVNSSSNIVAVIAVERLKNVIMLELLWTRKKLKSSPDQILKTGRGHTVKPFLCTSWCLAAVCSVPQLWFWQVLELRPGFYQCTTLWRKDFKPASGYQAFYNAFHLCTTFWLPFLIIAVCYLCIAVKLLKLSCLPFKERRRLSKKRKFGHQHQFSNTYTNHLSAVSSAGHLAIPGDEKQFYSDCDPHSLLPPAPIRKIRSTTENDQAADDLSNVVGLSDETSPLPNGQPLLPELIGIPSWRLQMRSKIFRTTGLIVVAYAIFWLPYNTLGILVFIDEELLAKLESQLYWAKSFMLLTAVLNPLLYGW